ncbi:MAG: hypothetical protein AAGA56_12675 [Myxococcota bacterium]
MTIHRRDLILTSLSLGVGSTWGCGEGETRRTPAEVVRDFVERVQGFDGRPSEADAIYEALSERARDNLAARAERYGAASGKQIAASAMLVPGWVAFRFVPRTYTAQVVGRFASVACSGVRASERAEIPCVREDDQWKVDLALPDLPPAVERPATPR